MKSTQPKQLHDHQLKILKKLVLTPELRFNQLLSEDIDSELMNYHLQKLMEYDLVQKVELHYSLTNIGKDYTNLLDDNVEKIERQPKTGVIIRAARYNKEKKSHEDLFMKRLRTPYYGKVGRVGGKVQFGETLEQAARRELKEETGLDAGTLTLERIFHKLRHDANGTFVQDVIFYIFFTADVSGELTPRTPYQENFWATRSEVEDGMDPYDDIEYSTSLEPKPLIFEEHVHIAQGY